MDVPDAYLCPITREIMKDPVIAQDGFSYEREAISKWLLVGRKTSPITNGPLECTQIFPNRALKGAIGEYVGRQRERFRASLIDELGRASTNGPHEADDPIVRYAMLNNNTADETALDTFAVVHGILTTWKHDPEVCEAAMTLLVRLMDGCDDEDVGHMHRKAFFDVVMDLMRRFEAAPAVQTLGLKYVQRYSQAHGFVKAVSIHRYRACDVVVGCMRTHPLDRHVQVEGSKAIGMLGQNFPSHIFKTGVARVLLTAAANFTEDPDVVVALCRALLRLTSGTCARLCHMGFCRRLADAMLFFPRHQELQESCCLALGRVCHSKTHCNEAVCDVVVTCLQEFANAGDVAHAACAAIAKMAFWNRFAARIGDLGACDTVLRCLEKAMEDRAEEHVATAMLALEMLTCENETNRLSLSTSRAGKAMTKTLTLFYEHRRIVLSVMRTLHNLVSAIPVFAELAREDWAAPPKVVRAMRRHLGEEEVQEAAWALLDKLARRDAVDDLVMLTL